MNWNGPFHLISNRNLQNWVPYVAAVVIMLKALPLAHFLSVLLLKEQMIISVKKKSKDDGQITAKAILIFSEICLEISTKLAIFYRLFFGEVRPK